MWICISLTADIRDWGKITLIFTYRCTVCCDAFWELLFKPNTAGTLSIQTLATAHEDHVNYMFCIEYKSQTVRTCDEFYNKIGSKVIKFQIFLLSYIYFSMELIRYFDKSNSLKEMP
jgi:hypothetical protein